MRRQTTKWTDGQTKWMNRDTEWMHSRQNGCVDQKWIDRETK